MPSSAAENNATESGGAREAFGARLDTLAASFRGKAALALFIAALAVIPRIAYFSQAVGTPLATTSANDQTDMFFFDLWAKRIAAGDWLSDTDIHPMHSWHYKVAADYFNLRPDVFAELSERVNNTGGDPATLLWSRLQGGKRFHQEPLYPYLIAITYKIFGADPRYVFAWQMVAGVCSAVLVFLITLRLFGPAAAVIGGAMCAVNGPLMWQEVYLLRTSLSVLAGLAAVYMTIAAMDKNTPLRYLAAGICFGIGALAQSYFILYFLPAVALMAWRLRREPLPAVKAGLLTAAGFLIALSPAIARNLAVGAPALSLLSQGSYFFIMANAPDLNPSFPVNILTPYTADIVARTNGGGVADYIGPLVAAHGGIFNYAHFLLAKFAEVWGFNPMSDNGPYYYYFLWHSTALKYSPAYALPLFPLALAGLALSGKRLGDCAPLLILIMIHVIVMTVFVTFFRYRVPLAVAVIPFSALALAKLLSRGAAVTGAGAIVFVIASLAFEFRFIHRPPDFPGYASAAKSHFRPMIHDAEKSGSSEKAAKIYYDWFSYENGFEINPDNIRPGQKRTAAWYAGLLNEHASLLRSAGRVEEAGRQAAKAETIVRNLKTPAAGEQNNPRPAG
ncbi:MAG: glycosyltransferase family 39 protein [Nitrospinae bacterium]|nr:glycosyltransferase family 39 protein [Nitrospinota bacterium]